MVRGKKGQGGFPSLLQSKKGMVKKVRVRDMVITPFVFFGYGKKGSFFLVRRVWGMG